ncbi:hypothetical protein QA612_07200 [Evansella sp. AB-P1]|uniref:hypothetical protein n=1 Tax=Evansella sp. AB-P1 TaxID=3037653 RepID=UPI00241C599F|nr:hypothetical protein [Evansella sp. AB-P1]MDG5787276.1 hypothetical protein [Evansella sp. AB-P1]
MGEKDKANSKNEGERDTSTHSGLKSGTYQFGKGLLAAKKFVYSFTKEEVKKGLPFFIGTLVVLFVVVGLLQQRNVSKDSHYIMEVLAPISSFTLINEILGWFTFVDNLLMVFGVFPSVQLADLYFYDQTGMSMEFTNWVYFMLVVAIISVAGWISQQKNGWGLLEQVRQSILFGGLLGVILLLFALDQSATGTISIWGYQYELIKTYSALEAFIVGFLTGFMSYVSGMWTRSKEWRAGSRLRSVNDYTNGAVPGVLAAISTLVIVIIVFVIGTMFNGGVPLQARGAELLYDSPTVLLGVQLGIHYFAAVHFIPITLMGEVAMIFSGGFGEKFGVHPVVSMICVVVVFGGHYYWGRRLASVVKDSGHLKWRLLLAYAVSYGLVSAVVVHHFKTILVHNNVEILTISANFFTTFFLMTLLAAGISGLTMWIILRCQGKNREKNV